MDLTKWAQPTDDTEEDEELEGEPTLAYVPQKTVRLLEDDEEAQRAFEAFELFLSYGDELEKSVATGTPWPKALTAKVRAALEGLDDVWIDGIADALTGETLTIDAGMTAVSNWIRRHILR